MTALVQFAQLALIGWLPGTALFRLPWLDRDRRAALDAEERAFWAIVLSLALSLGVVLGLAIFHRYSFQRLMIADLGILVGCWLVARGRLRLGSAARHVTWTAILPLAI